MSEPEVISFQAEVSQVLRLVVNSLYSHKEIFLRELVSNASDAIDKLRFRSIGDAELVPSGTEFRIRIAADEEKKTLTISDNGQGMSRDELIDNLGTIARSGTREFLAKLEESKKSGDVQLIGQFGVGFYSAFLVADRVEVVSRAAGSEEAHRWVSDAKESFTIEPASKDAPGTEITLHLSDGNEEFTRGYRLRQLIAKYSDYVGHPIEMLAPAPPEKKEGEEETPPEPKWERVNQASALWRRNPKDLEKEQYEEFYKHLGHDWEAPLAYRHFQVEGTQMFSGLLFLPRRAPFDLFDKAGKHGVRLHVKRVFIMDNCEELLPPHLRFVKGLVDSEDLPLNVSRELLQDNRAVAVIRKQVVNHSLLMVEALENDSPDDFKIFWSAFGVVLKEGLHYSDDDKEKQRIAKLLRFSSSTQEGLTSLDEYVGRMKENQKAIYYATGASRALLETSPHLEGLKKHGYEVLYLTDAVDPFAVAGLPTFADKPLVSGMDDQLDLEETAAEADKEERETKKESAAPLFERFKSVLGEHISEVRASERLTDSAVCLVTPESGVAPHIEQLMRAQNPNMPKTKRLLEVNASHPLIESLKAALEKNDAALPVDDWIGLLYDQALIAEGSPVDDPGSFSRRLSQLMQRAVH